MTLDEALTTDPDPETPAGEGEFSGWLPFCMVEVSTGSIWAGDPTTPEPDKGCQVELNQGLYRVEGRIVDYGPTRSLARLRVSRQEFFDGEIGPPLGEFHTGSGLVAVGDLGVFGSAHGGDAAKLRSAIDRQLQPPCCLLVAPGIAATMPVVPSPFGEGTVPVFDLLGPDGERVGLDLEFIPGGDAWD